MMEEEVFCKVSPVWIWRFDSMATSWQTSLEVHSEIPYLIMSNRRVSTLWAGESMLIYGSGTHRTWVEAVVKWLAIMQH